MLRYVALCCIKMLRYVALCCVMLRYVPLLQGAVLLPLIMYVDGTWLSANSNHTAKPCWMGIGNHSIDAQHDLNSKKVRNAT
jgi:hypothetical protein